jgi:hypothetical protein
MHKSATKCNEIVGKWCINKHRASKIIDTSETYHPRGWPLVPVCKQLRLKGVGFSPEYLVPVVQPGLKPYTNQVNGPFCTSVSKHNQGTCKKWIHVKGHDRNNTIYKGEAVIERYQRYKSAMSHTMLYY